MILDSVLLDVIAMEKVLAEAGYEFCTLTGPYGILSKLDFEKPDILLFNPDIANVDADALLETISQASTFEKLVIILVCEGEVEAIEEYCEHHNLHGYYHKINGFEGLPAYLRQFFAS